MVHALNEIERVLDDRALLMDLRPLLDRWPLEVAGSDGSLEAGRATDLAEPLSDDAAANAAVLAWASSGLFRMEQQDTFPLFYYWDTPRDMQDYLVEEWDDVITVEEPVWKDLRSMWAQANADARVRIRVKMLITSYRRSG